MNGRILRVLLLEDSAADAELVVEALTRADLTVTAERVQTEAAFVAALARFRPDLVLSDHAPGMCDAQAALEVLRAQQPGTPFIVLTRAVREDVTAGWLRAGAENVVWKENLRRLRPAVETALQLREPLHRLSRRQLEILRLVAEGRSTRSIARELKLSIKTIETHRAAGMRRLGVHGRVGLVRYAVRVGLIPPDPERRT